MIFDNIIPSECPFQVGQLQLKSMSPRHLPGAHSISDYDEEKKKIKGQEKNFVFLIYKVHKAAIMIDN